MLNQISPAWWPRFEAKIKKTDSCWLWTASRNLKGYGEFRLQGKLLRAHRASFAYFKGEIPSGLLIMHLCDIPACVNPEHLALGTSKDNSQDRDLKGRRASTVGALNGAAKLTATDVAFIRAESASKAQTQKQLAERFNVSSSLVSLIAKRKIWKGVLPCQ